jgi:hypothetical protein
MKNFLLRENITTTSFTVVESVTRQLRRQGKPGETVETSSSYIPTEAVFANDIAEQSTEEDRSWSPMDCTPSGSESAFQPSYEPTLHVTAPYTHHLKQNPLEIPEILQHILSFLETNLYIGTDPEQPLDFVKVDSIKYTITKPRLHSASLVNKLWNACATKALWQNIKIGHDINNKRLANTLSMCTKRFSEDALRAVGKVRIVGELFLTSK